jgi:hypothetical protein
MRAKRDGADIPQGFKVEDILWVWVETSGIMVLSIILCEIVFCQFFKEWQVVGHFPYGF